MKNGFCLIVLILIVSVGCGGPRPRRPAFSPSRSSEQAMELYDANKDGLISSEEAAQSPGLQAAFERIDEDGDGSLTAEEIANRVAYYKRAGVAVVSGSAEVYLKGKPLGNATVIFEPESFLGEEFKACQGVTDEFGQTYLSRDDAEFPGLYLGFYRVRITQQKNGKERINAKYNTETELGFEAADDIPNVKNVIRFDLD